MATFRIAANMEFLRSADKGVECGTIDQAARSLAFLRKEMGAYLSE
jgi:hypothetical protein